MAEDEDEEASDTATLVEARDGNAHRNSDLTKCNDVRQVMASVLGGKPGWLKTSK